MKKAKAQRKTNARSNSRVKNKTRLSSPVPNHAPTNPNDSDTIKFSQSDMKIKQDRDHKKYKDKIYNLTQIQKELKRLTQDKCDEIYACRRNIRRLENYKKQLYNKIQKKRTPINSLKNMCSCRNSLNSTNKTNTQKTIKVSFSQTSSQESEEQVDKGVDRDEYERLYGLNKKGQSFYIV